VRGADRAPADPRLRRAAGIGPVAAGSGRGDRRRAPSLLASLVRPRSASRSPSEDEHMSDSDANSALDVYCRERTSRAEPADSQADISLSVPHEPRRLERTSPRAPKPRQADSSEGHGRNAIESKHATAPRAHLWRTSRTFVPPGPRRGTRRLLLTHSASPVGERPAEHVTDDHRRLLVVP
jgi:hypothetical protein